MFIDIRGAIAALWRHEQNQIIIVFLLKWEFTQTWSENSQPLLLKAQDRPANMKSAVGPYKNFVFD